MIPVVLSCCSSPAMVWNMQFAVASHKYYAILIVAGAFCLFCLPFLLGARLGAPVKYTFVGHMKILALLVLPFLFFVMFLSSCGGNDNFGFRLLLMFYSPFFLVIEFLRCCFPREIFSVLKVIAIFGLPLLYSWILVPFDRDIIWRGKKPGKNSDP